MSAEHALALATASGRFTIAALDHRDALVAEFDRLAAGLGGSGQSGDTGPGQPGRSGGNGPGQGGAEALRRFKADVLAALGQAQTRPSAVMLEPEYSLPDLRDAVPEGVGVTCALEAQGYFDALGDGNAVMEGWSPARVRTVGADGAKLLVLYRHDRGAFTDRQERLVADVTAQAAEAGVPALIEPVPVEVVDDADRRAVIVNAARRIGALGPMILKLPFPGAGACAEVTEAAGSHPWVLLSWGVTYDEFRAQLAEAMAAGCAGFAVGRALWREAVDPADRAEFLAGPFQHRLAELIEIVESPSRSERPPAGLRPAPGPPAGLRPAPGPPAGLRPAPGKGETANHV